MSFGVTHDVEVDKFFELKRAGFHVFYYIHKEHGDVFASGHRVDDSSDGFLFCSRVNIIEFGFELSDLTTFFCHLRFNF